MNENCAKIKNVYADLLVIVFEFRKLKPAEDRIAAKKLQIRIEDTLSVLKTLCPEDVYSRKALADRLGCWYVDAFDENGLARAYWEVKDRSYVYFINKKGEFSLGKRFMPATPFKNGLACCTVRDAGKHIVINDRGAVRDDLHWDYALQLGHNSRDAGFAEIKKDGKVLERWTRGEAFGNRQQVEKDGEVYFIEKDKKGKIVFDTSL